MLLKQAVQVTRRTRHWEEDDWIQDEIEPFPVKCSVQTTPGESHDSDEEGRRKKSSLLIVSKERLFAASGEQDADIIDWQGEQFEVVSVKPAGQGTRLAHYKTTAESVKDHTDAAL
ncbi:MAG: hypothetical protein PQJ58_15185 [Spirochaetales bacterium]|nr:hypothetical protein [Spirochaetales bacterium]